MQFDQQTAERTTKLIAYQLEATETLEAGKLREKLFKVITEFKALFLCGRQISQIEVMNSIKKVFVAMGKLRAPTNHHLVRKGIGGPIHTELVNRQFGLICTSNPVIFNQDSVHVL